MPLNIAPPSNTGKGLGGNPRAAPVALPPILPAPRASRPAPRAAPARPNPLGAAIAAKAGHQPEVIPTRPPKAAPSTATVKAEHEPEVTPSRPTQAATQAIKDVFSHQDLRGQASLINGVLKGRADPYTAKAIRDAWQGLGHDDQIALTAYLPHGKGIDVGGLLNKLADHLNPENFYGGASGKGKGSGGGGLASVPTMFGGQKGAEQVLKNSGKDLLNLGPGTVEGLYGIGKQLSQGNVSGAVGSFVDPYVKFFEHPTSTFYNDPVNTAMLFGGVEAVGGRAVGSVMRSGALGERAADLAGTARAPVRLGPDIAGAPSPIEEARSYSGNVITKAAQVTGEKLQRRRGIDPNVARPKPGFVPTPLANSLNLGLEAKTRRIPDEMTAVHQMGSREARTEATHFVRAARPHKSVEGIVAHILQGVVRTPETAVADLSKEINRLKAADHGLRSIDTLQNRRQVRALDTALRNPGRLDEAFKSADTLRPSLNNADKYSVYNGLLDPEQALRSRLIPYAMAHMGAKWDHDLQQFAVPGARIVKASDGRIMRIGHARELPTAEILQHIKDEGHGMPDPAYVGHYPGKVSPMRFYQAYKAARGTLSGSARKGGAFARGGYDASYDGLVAQAARTSQALSKAGLHDRVVNRLGIGKSQALQDPLDPHENGYFTPDEAKRYAEASQSDDNLNSIPGSQPLVPMTAFGHRTRLSSVADLQSPADLEHIEGHERDQLQASVDDAKDRAGTRSQARNVVLVPEHAMDQFSQQFKPAGATARKFGQLTQQFRRTVLPYSTHWMTQIGTEAGLRSLVAGTIDPRNIVAGHQMMKELERSGAGRNAAREIAGATFYNKRDPLAKFNPDPSPTMEALRHSPAGAVMAAHNRYADAIGKAIGGLEHEARTWGLGKMARKQVQEFTGSYQLGVRMQGRNVAMLAEKLKTDPALVAKLGRQMDDTFGKYNKLTPQVRAMVQTVTPFLPWYLNAAKFVLWNLPVKHPVASALLASVRQTVKQDAADGKKAPLNAFQVYQLSRLSPFGIYPQESSLGSAVQTATSAVLPQFSGSMDALLGDNTFGDERLYGPHGDAKPFSGQALQTALNSALEGVFPGLSYAQTARQGGRTSYGTSTLWSPQPKTNEGKGDLQQILNRIFNPFHGIASATAPATSSKSSSSSSGGWWDSGSSSGSSGSGWWNS